MEPDEFLDALQIRFNVTRELADGTPVTGFTPAERAVITRYYPVFTRQARDRDRLAITIKFPPGANCYTTIMLAFWQFLAAEADARNKQLVWASTTTRMDARVYLNSVSLSLLSAVNFTTWEKLALLERQDPQLMNKLMIVGDVDYEQNPEGRLELSDTSDRVSIGHTAVIATVKRVAQDPRIPVVFLHREGWQQAFEPEQMLADALSVVPQNAPALSAPSQPLAVEPKSGGCFIATACCGSPADPLVRELRRFRDGVLMEHAPGRGLAGAYARFSPPVADWIGGRAWARTLVRHLVVRPLAWTVRTLGGCRRGADQ